MNRFAKYLVLGIALSGLVIAGCGEKKKNNTAGASGGDNATDNGSTEKPGKGLDDSKTPGATNEAPAAAAPATAPTAATTVDCPKTCDKVLGVVMKGIEEKLAQMPPEQKVQLETQMKAQMARGRTQCMAQCEEKPVLYSCLSTAATAEDIQACAVKHSPPQPPRPPTPNAPTGAPAPGKFSTAPPTKPAVKVTPETEVLCSRACDNALSLANTEAQKRMKELPPEQRAKMETQLQAFMAQGKSRCMMECRTEPERAQCVADAKDMDAMKLCAPPQPRPAPPQAPRAPPAPRGGHDHSVPGHKH